MCAHIQAETNDIGGSDSLVVEKVNTKQNLDHSENSTEH